VNLPAAALVAAEAAARDGEPSCAPPGRRKLLSRKA